MEDKRIVVAFDIHGTLLRFPGLFKKVYKDGGKFQGLTHLMCNSSLLVFLFTIILSKNKVMVKKMADLYESGNFKVVLLTDSYKSSEKILFFILKRIKRIYCFHEIICRDNTCESDLDCKVRLIEKHRIQFLFDDRTDILKAVMDKTDCLIGLID